MLVQDLMTTDVVTVPAGGTLRDAVEQLLTEDVGSVIVASEAGNPVGIVTSTDVLRALYETEQPLDGVDIADMTHRPVVTTKPAATVTHLANRMATKGVKKAPVMDDLDLVGIVTMTDIVRHLSQLREEARGRTAEENQWSTSN